MEQPRAVVMGWAHLHERPMLIEFLGCYWCVGTWVAGAVGLARHAGGRKWGAAARVLAISALVGLVAESV